MYKGLLFLISFLPCLSVSAQVRFEPVPTVTHEHLRGLSVVSDSVVWASGTHATWLRTTDGGLHWVTDTVTGALGMDLRDIHAFDDQRALVMTAGEPGLIFLTTDGGKMWKKVYENHQPGIFLDGIDFSGDTVGYAFGDPMDGHFFVLKTSDGGMNWMELNKQMLPSPAGGEAGYAASGTGIVVRNERVWIGTGGPEKSRVLCSADGGRSWDASETPMRLGDGAGIFSMVFTSDESGVVVGGHYLDSTSTLGVCAVTTDGGVTWESCSTPPNGYRSCVAAWQNMLVAVGRTGSDVSSDGGQTWTAIGTEGYYACHFGKTIGWAVGRGGKMARILLK
ncbi:MAG: hypothetical protein KDD36_07015 [Flavobacteriales bacterium]|nr:hypothetical protein [Flavobacteriales bacterium]